MKKGKISSKKLLLVLQRVGGSCRPLISFVRGHILFCFDGLPSAGVATVLENMDYEKLGKIVPFYTPEIMNNYRSLYDINTDMIGWLYIEDTVVDYPVMQTPEDENYYS